MLKKIKALPEKTAFFIGISLILFNGMVLFLFSYLIPIGFWTTTLIQGIVYFFAILFILSAADKRHARIKNKK